MGGDGPLGFDEDPEAEAAARRQRLQRRRDEQKAPSAGPDYGAPERLTAGAPQYGWFIAVLAIVLIGAFTISNLVGGGKGPGSSGITDGGKAPPFAAPLALAKLSEAKNNQVNVAVKADQGDAGNVPACSLRRPDVLNFCALYEKGPVVLAFFATNAKCVKQLDVLDTVARRHPDVSFAAVSIRGDLGDIRAAVRARRWSFPVGYDDDGVLANAFGVAICPQITYVRRGGAVQDTSLGTVAASAIDAEVRRLEQ